jgi:hypothetical protein
MGRFSFFFLFFPGLFYGFCAPLSLSHFPLSVYLPRRPVSLSKKLSPYVNAAMLGRGRVGFLFSAGVRWAGMQTLSRRKPPQKEGKKKVPEASSCASSLIIPSRKSLGFAAFPRYVLFILV